MTLPFLCRSEVQRLPLSQPELHIHDVTYLQPLISADPAIVASCSDSAGVAEQRQRPGSADREEARGLGPARTVAAAAETSRQGKINRVTRAPD
jgi:hypothetical protein